jgi:hypothetical protein
MNKFNLRVTHPKNEGRRNIMKNLKLVVLSALLIGCMAMMAQAIPYYQLAGDFQLPSPGWNVSDSSYQFYDTGTGLYALTTTVVSDAPGSHSGFSGGGYKITNSYGNWNTLEGNNSWIVTTVANQVVTWYLDPNQEDTSWTPNTNVVWSTAQTCTTGIYTAVGLDTWLGNTIDFDPTFSGATMHSIGGGIYALSFTFSTTTINPALAPVKAYKVDLNKGTNEEIANDGVGFSEAGQYGNVLNIASYNSHDTITLYVDTIKGKLKVVQAYPAVSGQAPWYALGDITGLAQLPSTEMSLASTGIYTLNAVATFSDNTHWVNVTDQAGNRHPTSSNTLGAFFNATTGQSVTLTYDANTHLDGWLPYTNFAYATPTSTIGTHTYGIVGQVDTFFGVGADWSPTLGFETMTSTDGLTYVWEGVVVPGISTLQQFGGKICVDNGYTLQIGNDGKSISGNPPNISIKCIAGDTILFKADVYRGRYIIQNLTHPATAEPQPTVTPNGGKPGSSGTLTASGGTPPYIGWTSSDTTAVEITGFTGTIANVNYNTIGSSMVTVYDSLGQSGSAVISTTPTSAPLAPESAFSSQTRSTILWDFKE